MLITVLGIGYAGFQYVGIGNKIINKPFTVTAEFDNSGGIYPERRGHPARCSGRPGEEP